MKTDARNPSKPVILKSASQLRLYGPFVLGILTILLLEACQQPTTVAPPDKPTTTPPGSSTTAQPGDSVKVPKKLTISWSANDFQEILYDAQGLPLQYTSQYVNDLSTGQVQRLVYKLHYTSQKQLEQIDVIGQVGSTFIRYHYKGGQISQTTEHTLGGSLLNTSTYQYSAPNRLSQVDERRASGVVMRRTYQYDAAGNLIVVSFYEKNPASDTYVLGHTIHYGEYDNYHEVENLLFHTPMLPGVRFRANNHRVKSVQDPDGQVLSRERINYTYNEQGYPTQQVRTGPGGTLTATYTY